MNKEQMNEKMHNEQRYHCSLFPMDFTEGAEEASSPRARVNATARKKNGAALLRPAMSCSAQCLINEVRSVGGATCTKLCSSLT
jgi:hypothetical protein